MVTVSSPSPSLTKPSMVEETDEVDVRKMDGLLEELKTNMVELILQGDDVTHQMWRMYSVFEEIFGRQTMTTSSNQPLKHVVVGLKSSSSSPSKTKSTTTPPTTTTSPPASSKDIKSSPSTMLTQTTTTTNTIADSVTTTTAGLTTSKPTFSSPKDSSDVLPENDQISASPQNKVPKYASPQTSPPKANPPSDLSSGSTGAQSGHIPFPEDSPTDPLNPTSNPLLDTIGSLANTNQDSDDSDLDIVYQQLRYRGRQRKQDQMRLRTHRTHRHHQVANSDPESIGYAGSNSIDSGYKSLCATPEVSDSLSAPEVRRSASDVSASDSSTTSGRPRSLDGQDGKSTKIKMGTRSIAGKLKAIDGSPRQMPTSTALNDVTLDHLMYLRQSLRKDRSDTQRSSPIESLPSSATSSTFRDSDLSPRTLTDEEWRDGGSRPPSYPFRPTSSSSSPETFARSSSRGSPRVEVDQEGGGESSSDFLLSGVEYYDLESIQEFPTMSHNYVTMEEKTRCAARLQVMSAPRSSEPLTERQLSSLYRKRSESTQSVDGDFVRHHSHPQQNIYGLAGHPSRPARNSAKALSSRHHRQHHATDSKLTEAAIRVLEMIEDFRMEESMTRSGRLLPYQGEHLPNPSDIHHQQQTILPRYRKATRSRPASTGSLMEQEIDARSVASSYAASAEHHVYEEIMYDLVCERGMMPPPIPPERGGRIVSRSRLLPVVPPHTQQLRHQQQAYAAAPSSSMCVDPRRIMVRSSHKHRSSNMYSVMSSSSTHGRGNVDRYLEMEWHLAHQERRDSLPPDFPV